jgi:hypothetical protein
VSSTPGNFILELMKAMPDDNHHFGHDFIAQLSVIFEQLKEAALRNPDSFAASRSATG